MATKTITSEQSGPKLPGATTPLFIKTQSVFTPDVNGNPIAERPIVNKVLYDPVGAPLGIGQGTFIEAAISTEGGKPGSWVSKKYTAEQIFSLGIGAYAKAGDDILGPTALLSLNTKGGILYEAAQNSIKQSATSAGITEAYQKPLASSLQNTAIPSAGSTPSAEPTTLETITDLAKGIPGIEPRTEYGNLRYPKDLTPTSDSIQFTMISYGTKTFKNDTFGLGERDFNKIKINGIVTMSVQPSISDLNYVRWSPSEMGPIATAAADSSLTFIEEGAQGLESIKDKIAGTLGKEGESIAKAIIASAAGQASGAKGLLTRVTGAMFNNNLELLFQGPELRQFTFTFKLSPRYKGEADDVKKIIRFFKQGSAVQRTTSNLFLKSPNVFRIKYLNGNKDHKSLNRMKECALVSCGVDYTPTGSYMTFNDEDASMVSYTLSLTFNELEPIYEDEYQNLDKSGGNDSGGIGY